MHATRQMMQWPGGTNTDNQAFCYDEQNRLTWATSQTVAAPPVDCSAHNAAGSLSGQGAVYSANYAYDALNRLTTAPLGSYTYGASPSAGPLHAATSAGSSQTGQSLGYDSERRQTSWQSTPGSSPTTKAAYAYDGAGQRVAMQTTNGALGTTTTSPCMPIDAPRMGGI